MIETCTYLTDELESVDGICINVYILVYDLLHKILNSVLLVLLGLITELDSVTSHSEIVPDTVIFDDFQRSITYSTYC